MTPRAARDFFPLPVEQTRLKPDSVQLKRDYRAAHIPPAKQATSDANALGRAPQSICVCLPRDTTTKVIYRALQKSGRRHDNSLRHTIESSIFSGKGDSKVQFSNSLALDTLFNLLVYLFLLVLLFADLQIGLRAWRFIIPR